MACAHMSLHLPLPSLHPTKLPLSNSGFCEEKAALRFCPPSEENARLNSRSSSSSRPHRSNSKSRREICYARGPRKKKNWDPFNYGEDPRLSNGPLYGEGLQDPEEPRFPVDPNDEYGFLDVPQMFQPEVASLPILLRGDVRRCCCLVAGGVYENLLFFPAIQLLKDRYPGVIIDVVATARGKQTYEINKNVKRAWVYDVDAQFVEPAEYTELVGKLKNEYYDLIVSTRLSGFGHAVTLWLTSSRVKVAYVYPNVNAAGSGIFLTESVVAPSLNLSEDGYNMYADLIEVLKFPRPDIPEMKVGPLEIGIARRLKDFVQKKYMEEEVYQGEFLIFHGIQSASNASMQSRGDLDSLLPLELWAELATAASSKVVVVIPYESDRLRVRAKIGDEVKVVCITTPGQLAAIINDSLGVVTTNTAAVQLACALKKPSVALFASEEKAALFVPNAKEKRCTLVASKTGKLVDVDLEAAKGAMKSIEAQLLVAA